VQSTRIGRDLKLVTPVDTDSGTTLYVHSIPISYDVFDKYAVILAETFAKIYSKELGLLGGPRVAARLLRQVAQAEPGANGYASAWEGPEGVENGLIAEMRRLTNVIVPDEGKGWTTVPFTEAVTRKLLSREDASDVENALTFFTVTFYMHRGAMRDATLTGAASLWGAEITSSDPMEYISSLRTSTETANSGETDPTSSATS
jgi:hypothetical protein